MLDERIRALNNPKGLSFIDLYIERMPMYEAAADQTLEVGDESVHETLQRLIELDQA